MSPPHAPPLDVTPPNFIHIPPPPLCCWVDYVIVTSDSGKIVILEYIPAKNRFKSVHEETFGKTGTRRIVPGQYLAVDPKGRATMIGNFFSAFVYPFNTLTIFFILFFSVF